jgi:nicotinate-nucleotide adenylyltransferase
MPLMKIALFGGSFDPPHLGHLQIALHILEEKIADEVWFVPAKKHPFGKEMLKDIYRTKMLKELLEDSLPLLKAKKIPNSKIKIETYEIDHSAISYSFNTLEHFAQTNPEHTFSWIIGTDNLPLFLKWYKAEDMLQKYTVLVYPRPGYEMSPLLPGMIPLHNMPKIDISSTMVRQKASTGESVKKLVSPKEEKFIAEKHFYTDTKN